MVTLRRLLPVLLLAPAVGLAALLGRPSRPMAAPVAPPARSVVYLAGHLPDEMLVALSAAVAKRPGATLLMDSPQVAPFLADVLAELKPDEVVAVGAFPESDVPTLSDRLGHRVSRVVACERNAGPSPEAVAGAKHAVACPAVPRDRFLKAAHLAAIQGAAMWVTSGAKVESAELRKWAAAHGIRSVLVVGDGFEGDARIKGMTVTRVRKTEALDQSVLRHLRERGQITTAVVANPADEGRTSSLAPWMAATRNAALWLTDADGRNVEALAGRAAKSPAMANLDAVLIAADQKAIPPNQRPNPIPKDKDKAIDLEPLTPTGTAPHSYAIGRVFHEDPAVVPLMAARQAIAAASDRPRKALVASNPGGGLSLLETFSRNTTHELKNAGYDAEGLFGKDLTAARLRRRMRDRDIILWEGHHNTLVKDWGFTTWDDPMRPSFVFLQSCLALQEPKVHPLMVRGAYAVLGTSTRTYSGSGGAFSLSYLNGVLYENQTLGGSLRMSKNFLLAYSLLKEKRLGESATKSGANHRAAWAFTLWGDPTFSLPRPATPEKPLPAVTHSLADGELVIDVPAVRHEEVTTDKYVVRMPANARLAGLIRKGDDETKPLVPFVFAEVKIPGATATPPRLRSRLPSRDWVWLWDARRKTGYVLAAPPMNDRAASLTFRVDRARAEAGR